MAAPRWIFLAGISVLVVSACTAFALHERFLQGAKLRWDFGQLRQIQVKVPVGQAFVLELHGADAVTARHEYRVDAIGLEIQPSQWTELSKEAATPELVARWSVRGMHPGDFYPVLGVKLATSSFCDLWADEVKPERSAKGEDNGYFDARSRCSWLVLLGDERSPGISNRVPFRISVVTDPTVLRTIVRTLSGSFLGIAFDASWYTGFLV